MIVKNYTTVYWSDLLASYASDLPAPRLLAWIGMESSGFPQALGACTEVGIFQIDLQDGPRYGGSTDTLHTAFCTAPCQASRTRDLTDDEEQLQVTSGAAMVREYLADAQSRIASAGLGWTDDDTWCLVKLQHALPALRLMLASAAGAGQAIDWPTFRGWATNLTADQIAATGAMSAATAVRYMPMDRYFDNGEKVGYLDGAGLVGDGRLSSIGKAAAALILLFAMLYYGGKNGLV